MFKKAVDVLTKGGLVVFPTETVYGLGADATNDRAVASIFEKKGRPQFNPLIAHCLDIQMALKYVDMDETAIQLLNTFSPGPLTLVCRRKKNCDISLLASAGLDTLAIRIPNNPIALSLIRDFGRPIVAPSANKSGRISPTTAEHVRADYPEDCPLILDGGTCEVGLESTIILTTTKPMTILRYGGLDVREIEKVTGPLQSLLTNENAPQSPGQLKSHYAPSLPLKMNQQNRVNNWAYLGFGEMDGDLNLSPTGDLKEAAANLFAMMHQLDQPIYEGILVAPIPNEGLGLAINDRLKRASYERGK